MTVASAFKGCWRVPARGRGPPVGGGVGPGGRRQRSRRPGPERGGRSRESGAAREALGGAWGEERSTRVLASPPSSGAGVRLPPPPHGPPFLFGEAPPDSVLLFGPESPLQALQPHGAPPADSLGLLCLKACLKPRAHREEELGVLLPAGCLLPPIHTLASGSRRRIVCPRLCDIKHVRPALRAASQARTKRASLATPRGSSSTSPR